MKKQIAGKKGIIKFLTEYIIMTLNELIGVENASDYNEGQIIAFVECLEILSRWKSFKKYAVGEIEAKYRVR